MSANMTDVEYMESKGCKCPACRSDQITSDFDRGTSSDGEFYQSCRCRSCGADWAEVTRIMGYCELNIPKIKKEVP